MKKSALLFLVLAALRVSANVPFFDAFANATLLGGTTYTVGSTLAGQTNAGNGWVSLGSTNTTTVEPLIVSGNLTYSNLPASSGNSIGFYSSAGRSARLQLNATVTTGRIYYSYILKVTDISALGTSAANNMFTCFSDDPSPQPNLLARGGARMVAVKNGSGYQLGIGKSSTPTDYAFDPTVRTVNSTVFVVASYERVGSSTIANLWVNPPAASFGADSPPAITAICTNGTTGDANSSGIKAFVVLCQNATAPTGIIDELRIGTTWQSVTSVPTNRPNIIFILADDLGYGDLGVLYQNYRSAGQPKEATPNLDTLASEGMILRQHYCPASLCAPSRDSLLMGVHQGHADVRNDAFDKALATNHNIATIMHQAGYATAVIGKWGLQGLTGSTPATWPSYPTKRGFDYFFGYVKHGQGHEHYPKEGIYEGTKDCMDGTNSITPSLDKCYTADLFTARAKKWIVDQRTTQPGQPFMLYLAYDTPHSVYELPTQAYPAGGGTNGGMQWLGTSGHMISTASGTVDSWIHPAYTNATYDDDGNVGTPEVPWPEVFKRYATSVRRLDDAVGDIRQLLKDLAIETNTLVVFTSDNGPTIEDALNLSVRYAANFFDNFGPFDGIKRDSWEGGIRMPTIVRWPGKVPAGVMNDTPSQFHDWLPTFAELGGVPSPARSDGVSLVPTLTGVGTQQVSTIYVEYFYSNSTPTYTEFDPAHRGRKRGEMQVIRLGGLQGVRYNIASHADDFEIYDVSSDLRQSTNLALNPAYATLQQQMKDRVLQLRRPEASAPRPYDNELVPAVSVSPVTAGAEWKTYTNSFPWVPELTRYTSGASGTTNRPTLSMRPRDNDIGVLFTGYLAIPNDGTYTFYLTADTGALLRIHDATVLDADYGYVSGSEVSGVIKLKAGLHPFRLYYARGSVGSPALSLSWSGPGIPKQPVPDTLFRRDGLGAPTAPTAVDDLASTLQSVPVTIPVLVNDFDDGLPAPLFIVSVTHPLAGTAVTNASKQIVYTPGADFLGNDTFSYTISDGQSTSTAHVNVSVNFADGNYWFPFNQTSGLTTPEAGGAGTAALVGFVNETDEWVAGKFNQAIQFDGSQDYVTISGFKGITGTNARTVSAWIKTTESGRSIGVVSWGDLPTGAKWSLLVQNTTVPLGSLRMEIGFGNSIASTPVNDGQWHHVAAVLPGVSSPSSTNILFYVDGVQDAISGGAVAAINTAALDDVLIGTDIQDRYFDGVIDEVRIYNRALSPSEIYAQAHATHDSADAWQRRYFGNLAINWNADDDGDGVTRLGEYAFGGQPHIADAAAVQVVPEILSNHLRVHFHRRSSGTSELAYQLQQSTDLANWSPLAGSEISSTPSPTVTGFDDVTYQANALITGSTNRFYVRVSATLP